MAENNEVSQELTTEESPISSEVKVETPKQETKVEQKAEKAHNEAKKQNKKKKAKDKKPNKIAKALKETNSELKKVTWPKFSTVVKQTGVVLLVAAIFLLVVFGLDRLCSWLVGFIV